MIANLFSNSFSKSFSCYKQTGIFMLKPYITTKKVEENLSIDNIFETLLDMLTEFNFVNDRNMLSENIHSNHKFFSPKISEKLFMYHSKSAGVKDFCAAILQLPDGFLYGMYAWPVNNQKNLDKISKLYEHLEQIQQK
ncbi:MAG: PTS sugar transporter subunit IIA [Treponema sp.]|nr:PTS sugar transporter subunit IIA [Treponema sp.]